MSKEKEPAVHLGFARKHRPQGFDEVVGQDAVSTTLKNALAENKPAHAYLFFGPRGVGKTTTARILAKALNCKKGPTPEPCGKCDACVEIALGSAIDVLELDAATHTQVDRIREMIIETVSLSPSRDRFKIFIIDEVHMLSTASFNALLKTLEEPPAHVVFILATTDPQKIPATIVSRCQRFRFRPMPQDLLAKHLQKLCKTEGISAEPAAVELLARAASGSVRDGVGLLEQVQAYAGGKLTVENVRELLGSLPEGVVRDLAQAVVSKDAQAVAKVLHLVWAEGFDPSQLLRDLRERLHEAYLHRLGVAEDLSPEWRSLAGTHPAETFGFLVGRTNKILESLRGAESPRLFAEQGIYGMLEAAHDLRGWIQRLEALERKLAAGAPSGGYVEPSSGPAFPPSSSPAPRRRPPASAAPASPASTPVSAKAAAPASAPSAPEGDVWRQALNRLQEDKPGLALDLQAARLVPLEGYEWRLLFQRAFDMERAKNNQAQIEAALTAVCGRAIKLKMDVSAAGSPLTASGGSSMAAQDDEKPSDDKESEPGPAQDPGLKKVLEIFPGKVRQVKKK